MAKLKIRVIRVPKKEIQGFSDKLLVATHQRRTYLQSPAFLLGIESVQALLY